MKRLIFALTATICAASACTSSDLGSPVAQKQVNRIEAMPNMPQPYKIIDWRQKTLDFDAYVFDFNSTLPAGPAIWLDDSRRNMDQTTFGLYTAMKDCRQGPDNNGGEFHESLNALTTLLGSGLVGIDKTNQNGYNYVKMIQNYFNTDNGWNIVMNNTCPEVALLGGGYGRDWWYDVFPNVLFYALCDVFPGVDNAENIQRTVAEQFVKADSVLAGNYNFSYFDYAAMEGKVNHIPLQQDAAGGHGYVLYSAYQKFGDKKYLEHAKSAIAALDAQTESRFYEILLPMGIYTAARLNAEQGCNYNIGKMLDWVFDGCKSADGRTGWGVICEKWGDYDVHGLQGSIIDEGGYAFLMNSIDLAWPFVPMIKYAPEYARAIGKWMLNNVNACRFFFPDMMPDSHQCLPGMQSYTNSIIAYEGLRKVDTYYQPERMKGVSPVVLGDGPKWAAKNPDESMFSVYSTSAVGIFGAMVKTTDIEGIIRLDCNVTDFYAEKPFPVDLCYNPHKDSKTITWTVSNTGSDIFDIVSKTYLAKNVESEAKVVIPADAAVVAVEIPAGSAVKSKNGKIIVNGKTISYE